MLSATPKLLAGHHANGHDAGRRAGNTRAQSEDASAAMPLSITKRSKRPAMPWPKLVITMMDLRLPRGHSMGRTGQEPSSD